MAQDRKADVFAQDKESTAGKVKGQREKRDPCNSPELRDTPMCKAKRARTRTDGKAKPTNPTRTHKSDIYGPSSQ